VVAVGVVLDMRMVVLPPENPTTIIQVLLALSTVVAANPKVVTAVGVVGVVPDKMEE
jgi:hypothetical protein